MALKPGQKVKISGDPGLAVTVDGQKIDQSSPVSKKSPRSNVKNNAIPAVLVDGQPNDFFNNLLQGEAGNTVTLNGKPVSFLEMLNSLQPDSKVLVNGESIPQAVIDKYLQLLSQHNITVDGKKIGNISTASQPTKPLAQTQSPQAGLLPGQQINASPGLNIVANGQQIQPNALGTPFGSSNSPGLQQLQAQQTGQLPNQRSPSLPGTQITGQGQQQRNMGAITPEQESWNPVNLLQQGQKPRTGAGEFFLGKQEGLYQVPTQTQQGMNVLQQLMSGGLQNLQNPYQGFGPIEQKARTSFHTQTVPALAERFTAFGGTGSSGGQRSSAFQGALGAAGAGLEENLAALQSSYGIDNRNLALRQLQLGLTPQVENIFRPGTEGALHSAGQGVSSWLGKLIGLFI